MALDECIEKTDCEKPIEIVGYGMQCPICKWGYLKGKPHYCDRCGQKLDWENNNDLAEGYNG